MKFKILLSFLSFVLFVSCGNVKNKVENTTKDEVAHPKGELYNNYTANPETQAQKDENAIIEYASNKGLECSKMDNGVYVCNLEKGSGENLVKGGPVKAHYKGYFFDGNEFDSSYKRNTPLEFRVGQMIAGWNEWLVTVNEGTKATLLIPSAKAYGSNKRGAIPANSPLAFDVEVLMQTK